MQLLYGPNCTAGGKLSVIIVITEAAERKRLEPAGCEKDFCPGETCSEFSVVAAWRGGNRRRRNEVNGGKKSERGADNTDTDTV